MRENLKKEVYKIVENGEHINTLDATNRIVNLTFIISHAPLLDITILLSISSQ